MNKIFLAVLYLPAALIASEPTWLYQDNTEANSLTRTASACVDVNLNIDQAKVIAKAIATGRLSQAMGGKVTAKSELVTTTVESKGNSSTKDTLNESVKLESNHRMSELVVLDSGVYDINGANKFCILMKASLK